MIDKDKVKNILITRTDRLGDVILTLPLINETKKIFRNSKIFFLVKEYTSGLIEDYRDIDYTVTEENISTFPEKYRYFKNKKIDLAINVKPEFSLAFLFFLLRIKYRIGTGYRWYSFLYNCRVYEHRKDSVKHESDYNLNLIGNFFDEGKPEKKFYFGYTEEEKIKLNDKTGGMVESKYIIIHPGSGGSAKDLPVENLADFTNEFLKSYSEHKVILTGTEPEKDIACKIVNSVYEEHRNRVFDYTGMLNLRELMILTDNSMLFISNSTGPVHIAGALGKNIIGFYPVEAPMSEARWKPLSVNTIILKPLTENAGMGSITKVEIMKAVKKFIS
ncbi:MAG: glycosyltransferase family 9 protein [Ignavibacteria bacterium]|nr:glycosyltransferase family 9 protein [Ignavibacteria bacterium]